MSETQYWITEHMYNKKLDNKGQGSAELILIIGGLIIVMLLIAGYMSDITEKTQIRMKTLLKEEREFLLNKI